jgi:choline dehydrogenase-like flavoprotein
MQTSLDPQKTEFSLDVFGRFVCDGIDEALRSTDKSVHPDARPFDIIVIGGGSFGAIFAEHLFRTDITHRHRVLVLDAGPFLFPEHVQDLPMMGISAPGPVENDPGGLRQLVWGLPWRSFVAGGFPGLAFNLGGRSVFWGGWSPQLLNAEMPNDDPANPADTTKYPNLWPKQVVDDLNTKYFHEAAQQIGVTETNDFIFGKLHTALRQQLFDAISNNHVTNAVPFSELVNHLDTVKPGEKELSKLEAPLAVQGKPPRSGLFPINKFSTVPLLIEGTRTAWEESVAGLPFGTISDNTRKRMMLVPNIRVVKLVTVQEGANWRVSEVQIQDAQTGQRLPNISVPRESAVVIALGTIESARLAQLSFQGVPHFDLIGKNLIAHLRSNLTIRIPRASLKFLPAKAKDLQQSALFVKGRFTHDDGSVGHFHLQITASGGPGGLGTSSDFELFQKIPDIDLISSLRAGDGEHVAITIRSIGEMKPQNPLSRIFLDNVVDEAGAQRARVEIADPRKPETANDTPQTKRDRALWQAMDDCAMSVAQALANGQPFEILGKGRDGLGTTHHEAGPLLMGNDPAKSVTNSDGRFHDVENAYVAGPALFPTVGSPNPMLTGTALARRMAERIISSLAAPPVPAPEPGYELLFDGTEDSFNKWQRAGFNAGGPGTFGLVDGNIVAYPNLASGLLLLFYGPRTFGNFNLRVDFLPTAADDNSGIFVRFRYPRKPLTDAEWQQFDPNHQLDRGNLHSVAVATGFEAQIDDLAQPDDKDEHRTGAIYSIPLGAGPGKQSYSRGNNFTTGNWNTYEVEVVNNSYTVRVNGHQTTTFENDNPSRGLSPAQNPISGYLGLQAHTGLVVFRNIRIRQL